MTHSRSSLMAALAVAGIFVTAPAFAQSSGCESGQKILLERQSLIQQFNKLSNNGKNKQVDPRAACTVFTKLVTNGTAGVKWMTENKEWCHVPDQVLQNFDQDHKRAQDFKNKACGAAQKLGEMEKRAKQQAAQQQQQGGPGRLGGGGLTGTLSVPKGAL